MNKLYPCRIGVMRCANTICSRPCDMSRVQDIVEQKKKLPLFPGVISVFQYPPEIQSYIAVPQVTNMCSWSILVMWQHRNCAVYFHFLIVFEWFQTRAIFDGQHRCLAIHAILQVNTFHHTVQRNPQNPLSWDICTMVYSQGDDAKRMSFSHKVHWECFLSCITLD